MNEGVSGDGPPRSTVVGCAYREGSQLSVFSPDPAVESGTVADGDVPSVPVSRKLSSEESDRATEVFGENAG